MATPSSSGLTQGTQGRFTAAGGFSLHTNYAKCPASRVSVTLVKPGGSAVGIATTDIIESITVTKFSGALVKTVADLTSGASITAANKVLVGTASLSGFTNGLLLITWTHVESTS